MRPEYGATTQDLFSAEEIALAARASLADVQDILASGRVVAFRTYVAPADAIALVRQLSSGVAPSAVERAPITAVPPAKQHRSVSLLASGLIHSGFLALLVLAVTLGWLAPNLTEETLPAERSVKLVFQMLPGPGGGGGGGGLQIPKPAPPAARKAPAPVPKKVSSPVLPMRRPPPPPPRSTRRLEPPLPEVPKPIDTPRPEPSLAVQAPVVAVPADPVSAVGIVASVTPDPSPGPGAGGGVGSGQGAGSGAGTGSGLGPGSGGGTGGGPFRPGTGIEPPKLIREVRPTYTDEARRGGLEGDVLLEIVVTRDGRVGSVRTLRSLGAGLDQKAAEAVRQWRFTPARRQGNPIDVVVEVSVEFSLR